MFCGRQLDVHHRGRHRPCGGAGGGAAARPTSLAHLGPTTKLAGNLMRGGTTHLVERWRAGDALALTAATAWRAVAGIPTQVALMLRHPDFDAHRPVVACGPWSSAADRPRRRWSARPASGSARRWRRATRAPRRASGSAPQFTDRPRTPRCRSAGPTTASSCRCAIPTSGARSPTGEVGEVCLRSPAVMSGYWRDPDAHRGRVLTADGFVRTGDLGRLDEAGRLRLVGRAKEMYVRGGYNVYPMEVEARARRRTPACREVAVVARPDDVMGEVGVAFVVADRPGRPPDLDDAPRVAPAATSPRHKLPEELARRRRAAADPDGEGRPRRSSVAAS